MTEVPSDLRAEDHKALAARGIEEDEARRQLAVLRHPPEPVRLIRPCTLGDGILAIDPGEASAGVDTLMKFVPASGAATRMFADLLALQGERCPVTRQELASRAEAGESEVLTLLRFVDGVERFAFADALRAVLADRGHDLARLAADGPFAEMIAALVDPAGLGYASCPKGLLPFHRYGSETRTALEEHLVEAAQLTRDPEAVCRVHFTTSAEDRAAFGLRVAQAQEWLELTLRVRFEVTLSTQHPSTETLALDEDGAPFRDERGMLVFRPGGHGALIENLAKLDADLVHVKNIDNIAVERIARTGVVWKQALAGLALRLRREAARHLADIEAGRSAAQARAFAHASFGVESREDATDQLAALLRRPLRVCGVVRNTGEPGGGPFWVHGRAGRASRQIVESAQVDERSEEQRAIFASSTHFNPVDMVLALRDAGGLRHDLRRHVDPEAVFVAWKSWRGRKLLALERPGLWNGAMADWNTVFVEIPGETFTPVKTVLDLLRPEHQP